MICHMISVWHSDSSPEFDVVCKPLKISNTLQQYSIQNTQMSKWFVWFQWLQTAGVVWQQISPSELFYTGCLMSGTPCWEISPAHGTESDLRTCRACTSPDCHWNTRLLRSWGCVWHWTWLTRWARCCSPAKRKTHKSPPPFSSSGPDRPYVHTT